MPIETQEAVDWALQQTYTDGFGNEHQITKDDYSLLVDKVRQYFNENNIEYTSFSYNDLQPYLV